MSNPIYIEKTTFINSNQSAQYGYRISDNYENAFIDSFDSNNDLPNDVEILKSALFLFPQFFKHLKELEQGVNINGVFHEYSDIKQHLHILDEVL